MSAEIAKRLGTTIQGVHTWMVGPLWGLDPVSARRVVLSEAKFALKERGSEGIEEMLRFVPDIELLSVTQLMRNELIRMLNKARRLENRAKRSGEFTTDLPGQNGRLRRPETARRASLSPTPKQPVVPRGRAVLPVTIGKVKTRQFAGIAETLADDLEERFCSRVKACLERST